MVFIPSHYDPRIARQVQVPKHVASRQAGQQQVLRVRLGWVSAKIGVVRAFDGRLSRGNDAPRPVVSPVASRSLAAITRPDDLSREVMCAGRHEYSLMGTWTRVYTKPNRYDRLGPEGNRRIIEPAVLSMSRR